MQNFVHGHNVLVSATRVRENLAFLVHSADKARPTFRAYPLAES